MEINKVGIAGTMESSDITVTIQPTDNPGIEVILQSSVKKQFGKQIVKVIEDTIKSYGVENALVNAVDKGAIDYVIKARTEAALYRATGSSNYNWGE
ncbi:citrate lyase acyl carrier protein [Tissierella praeacuta]|uniref:Citrate lyase acyl carrier protein n=1 Tax=Tissierella praeacuta DSM 18095 TaxID=1123404 RepID=A0A1M4Y4T8_9FIRM|nr:citrate lyase acyl carrier protein [Tissierella praeacuta]TCU79514.1 citrate lyase subunit gamma (acyl carrier protein) [Tissierella praeacuta]SHF00715.1 citrate lyase subunit gamma (acyl carrier protein) [Tissierella praeacuta DSM 18095]SUO98855.1 Citrate lyase gamma chain [Tissierella praeacuta]